MSLRFYLIVLIVDNGYVSLTFRHENQILHMLRLTIVNRFDASEVLGQLDRFYISVKFWRVSPRILVAMQA